VGGGALGTRTIGGSSFLESEYLSPAAIVLLQALAASSNKRLRDTL
jgi:hypothetical protein